MTSKHAPLTAEALMHTVDVLRQLARAFNALPEAHDAAHQAALACVAAGAYAAGIAARMRDGVDTYDAVLAAAEDLMELGEWLNDLAALFRETPTRGHAAR